jgi:protein SCO1/2
MKLAGILKKIVILVVVLALPGFLYYLLMVEGKNRYLPLSIFGPKKLAKTTHSVGFKEVRDTIYHTLDDFKLTDQDGKPVSLKTFDHKIFIACFFYTNCPNVCGEMMKNLNGIAANYTKNKMVYFVSITVDPGRDSAAVLKRYMENLKPATKQWLFLTGDTSTIYNLARRGFLVNAVQTGKTDFIYSDKVMLVDRDKRIRGYYTGASTVDMERLDNEIKVLISEELLNDTPEY